MFPYSCLQRIVSGIIWHAAHDRAMPAASQSCAHHGPERPLESNDEPSPSAASVNGDAGRRVDHGAVRGGAGAGADGGSETGRRSDDSRLARHAGRRKRAGQGQLRHQLGRGSRAWRLLSGAGGRHLQELRPRRHHRARRSQRQQPHLADLGQTRFLHDREYAAVVRGGRQQRAGGVGGGDVGDVGDDVPAGSNTAVAPMAPHMAR